MAYTKYSEDIERIREDNLFMKYGSMLAKEKNVISKERKIYLDELKKLRSYEYSRCV
jgi:hypothetical protein